MNSDLLPLANAPLVHYLPRLIESMIGKTLPNINNFFAANNNTPVKMEATSKIARQDRLMRELNANRTFTERLTYFMELFLLNDLAIESLIQQFIDMKFINDPLFPIIAPLLPQTLFLQWARQFCERSEENIRKKPLNYLQKIISYLPNNALMQISKLISTTRFEGFEAPAIASIISQLNPLIIYNDKTLFAAFGARLIQYIGLNDYPPINRASIKFLMRSIAFINKESIILLFKQFSQALNDSTLGDEVRNSLADAIRLLNAKYQPVDYNVQCHDYFAAFTKEADEQKTAIILDIIPHLKNTELLSILVIKSLFDFPVDSDDRKEVSLLSIKKNLIITVFNHIKAEENYLFFLLKKYFFCYLKLPKINELVKQTAIEIMGAALAQLNPTQLKSVLPLLNLALESKSAKVAIAAQEAMAKVVEKLDSNQCLLILNTLIENPHLLSFPALHPHFHPFFTHLVSKLDKISVQYLQNKQEEMIKQEVELAYKINALLPFVSRYLESELQHKNANLQLQAMLDFAEQLELSAYISKIHESLLNNLQELNQKNIEELKTNLFEKLLISCELSSQIEARIWALSLLLSAYETADSINLILHLHALKLTPILSLITSAILVEMKNINPLKLINLNDLVNLPVETPYQPLQVQLLNLLLKRVMANNIPIEEKLTTINSLLANKTMQLEAYRALQELSIALNTQHKSFYLDRASKTSIERPYDFNKAAFLFLVKNLPNEPTYLNFFINNLKTIYKNTAEDQCKLTYQTVCYYLCTQINKVQGDNLKQIEDKLENYLNSKFDAIRLLAIDLLSTILVKKENGASFRSRSLGPNASTETTIYDFLSRKWQELVSQCALKVAPEKQQLTTSSNHVIP